MKKTTKFSIALVGSTVLGSHSAMSATTPGDHPFSPTPPPVAIDSFLSKLGLPADLILARASVAPVNINNFRANASGSPVTPSPTGQASGTPLPDSGTIPPPVTNPDGTKPPDSTASGTPNPGNTPTTPVSGGPVAVMSGLNFDGLKPNYGVGETVNVSVKMLPESTTSTNKVDLWAAITIPNVPDFIFFTGTATAPQFSLEPQPFLPDLPVQNSAPMVLVFPIPAGIGGNYTFYALLVEAGKNPLEGLQYNRSNLAMGTTTLANE